MNNNWLFAGIAVVLVIVGVAFFNSKMDTTTTAVNSNTVVSPAPTDTNTPPQQVGVMVGGALMVPNLDIVDNAKNASNVTTVVAAVQAAGLVDTLKGAGPFTVFAPTNAAFDTLPAGTVDTLLKPENKAKLAHILTYHVVPGRYTSADLTDGLQLTTVEGEKLTIKKQGDTIWVNGTAMVEAADVISRNGVTFVIDGVLIPKM